MKENLRVLHVLVSNRYSGAENVVCQIIHMFAQNDEVEMAYCSPEGPVRQALEERNVPFVPLQKATVLEIKRAIATYQPTTIHAHDMRASFLVALACGRIPYVSHIHNNGLDSRKPTLKAILYRLAAIRARHIFWVSTAAAEGYCFKRGLKSKSSVLYNVIDMEQLREKAKQAEQQDRYDVVFLGRISPEKDPIRLVRILQKCHARVPDMRAALIGTGPMEEEVKEALRNSGLETSVHCLGFMNNPYGILQKAKVMLMTSLWEGMPMCALEAMTLGVPIVSTPTDGLRELVDHGETGFLSDKDEQLVDNIVQMLQVPALQRQLSLETEKRIRMLMDLEDYKQTLLSVYH